MKNGKVLFLAEQREARRRGSAPAARERGLPAPDRLWELLDRNISITVWKNNAE